jgi:RNA polymerase sporulation-specific sigma factor
MSTDSKTSRTTAPELEFESDERLLLTAQEGNDSAIEHLLERYKHLVRAKARSYFIIGADHDDLIQEGMIGLYKAIRDFRQGRQASFRAFAELCVTRQMITAIKTASRQKHTPLNTYISLEKPIYQEEEVSRTLSDSITSLKMTDPADLIVSGEETMTMYSGFGEILSELECRVLKRYLDGKSYQEIAADLGRHTKSIDNALQRVKRKVETFMKAKKLPA